MKRKLIATVLCMLMMALYVGNALAVNVYTAFSPGRDYWPASGQKSRDYIVVQINNNSQFYGSGAGINFRACRNRANASNALTLRASDMPGYKQRDYWSSAPGLIEAKANLTSDATNDIIFSGAIGF